MSDQNTYNLSTAAAQAYESQKVRAVFEPLAAATLESVPLTGPLNVLDVASGTGIIPRLLSTKLAASSRIVGIDLNPAMLEVAARMMPHSSHGVEWFACDVSNLPFHDGEFDIAFCQQGLQFFPEKAAALREIRRVIAPGGRFILTCWSTVSPLFQAVSDSLGQRLGQESARKALEPFSFRDAHVIVRLLGDAGFVDCEVQGLLVHRALTPVRQSIRAEILASPYEGELRAAGEAVIEQVVSDVDAALEAFRRGDRIVVPQEAHLFKVSTPASG